jgi:hypothetical protein
MLWRFPHILDIWFSQYRWSLCVNLVSKLYGSFFFLWFLEYFCLIFHPWVSRSFSLIPSMYLGARMRFIIYLQHWSESMALAPLISLISPCSPQTLVFEFIQNRNGNHWIWKKPLFRTCSLCWGDPFVQVSFDLKHYSSRIKLGKKGANFGRKSRFSETSYWTMPSPTGQCPTWPG